MNIREWMRSWRGAENRDTDNTDMVVSSSYGYVSGNGKKPNPALTAAAETAASLVEKTISSAEVSVEPALRDALSPSFLGQVGRSLVLQGESLWYLDFTASGLSFMQAYQWDIDGGPSPSSWMYSLELSGPTTSARRTLPYDALLHFRRGVNPRESWKGRSALSEAGLTARLVANSEDHLADEMAAFRGNFLVREAGAHQQSKEQIGDAMRDAKGRSLVVETTRGNSDPMTAPMRDYQVNRFGAEPTQYSVLGWQSAHNHLLAALGVPPELSGTAAPGPAKQAAMRQFIAMTVQPLAWIIQEELSAKLETPVTLSFSSLSQLDSQTKSRAFAQYAAKLPVPIAARLAGLDLTDEDLALIEGATPELPTPDASEDAPIGV